MRVSVEAWNDHEKDWERELIQNIQLETYSEYTTGWASGFESPDENV